MKIISRLYYGPPDWVVKKTSARARRAFGFWLLVFWLGPGFLLWLFNLNAVWMIGLMSIVALWWTGLGTFGTETPVESENEEDMTP